VDYIE
jgi:protein-tyrosine phosphatase